VGRVLIYGDIALFGSMYIYSLVHPRPGWQYITAMLIATVGYALWFTARAQLGKSFTAQAEARELVTTGLYSKVRNPIYIFSGVGIAALCLAMRWYIVATAFVIVSSFCQWMRARTEAAVLEAKFGDAYRQYRAQTWF